MQFSYLKIISVCLLFLCLCGAVSAQNFQRDFPVAEGATIEIVNRFGRVEAIAAKDAAAEEKTDPAKNEQRVFLTAETKDKISENELKIESSNGKIRIEVVPADGKKRFDLKLKMPVRMRLKIETGAGEAIVSGDFALAEIQTETGTISADVPLDNLRYDFLWTESRPRFLSDVTLKDVQEKAAGKFSVSGKLLDSPKSEVQSPKSGEDAAESDATDLLGDESDRTMDESPKSKVQSPKSENQKPKTKTQIKLEFTTARGIILLNVPISEVSGDLRERPLTNAAKAIVRGGDSILTEAIHRASPKSFGEYSQTLPNFRREPDFKPQTAAPKTIESQIKKVLVSVTDINNRAISDLKKEDFTVSESGEDREILSVEPSTAPFNLVLLLDVSGSVDSYVNFIRKAARSFVKTVDKKDKIAVIIFNDDIKVISNFTTDKSALSESLDTFDAGGGTAYYDALGYTLSETLRPLKGERTAIVALTDGDDNKSFLPFDALLGSIQESGALIYPLYVPSTLVAAGSAATTVDPLRTRYLGLTTKAEGEGEKLAKVSGGVYYPITRLDELQKAYDDIVLQLRTAYTVTFRSDLAEVSDKQTASPRLKVRVKRENSFVKSGSVTAVADAPSSGIKQKKFPAKAQRSQSKDLKYEEVSYVNANVRVNQTFTPLIYQTNYPNAFLSSFASFAPWRETFLNNAQSAEISGNVEKVNYKQFLADNLKESKFENFDINKSQGAFLLNNGKETIAVSRWISPKRTRSYPYERVYDTLTQTGKKVTIIPVVKDEGAGGERDFLQWDTISLLSLLDVHVILAYYDSAEKNTKRGDQITAQKLDNNYINARLNEIFAFKGTSREWNERETKQLKTIFEKAKLSYQKIAKETQTYLHDTDAIDELIKYAETPEKFLEFSRSKSRQAQSREFVTEQPKEALSTDTKAKVTINNALFGKYFFTCDETKLDGKYIYLIEAKHSVRAKMPSKNDIKDGFVKMMLYTAMTNVKVGAKPYNLKVQIRLTSNQMKGSTNSDEKDEIINKFINENAFTIAETEFIKKLFTEARNNRFTVILEHAETAK